MDRPTYRQYIGARYVPKFFENSTTGDSTWAENTTYEPLTIVTWNLNSYTSKKEVPPTVGNPSSNPEYWCNTGNYNAYIGEVVERIEEDEALISGLREDVDELKFYVNVKDYGAVGDGETDDTLAIQNCINDAISGGYATIFIPHGIYCVSSSLLVTSAVGVNIIGEGIRSRLKAISTINDGIFKVSKSTRLKIMKMWLMCEGMANGINFISGTTLDADRQNLTYVKNMQITDFINYGCTLDCPCGYNFFEDITFRGDLSSTGLSLGKYFTNSAGSSIGVNYVYATHCRFEGMDTTNGHAIEIWNGTEIFITECDITNFDVGVLVKTEKEALNRVDGISFDNCSFFNNDVGIEFAKTNVNTALKNIIFTGCNVYAPNSSQKFYNDSNTTYLIQNVQINGMIANCANDIVKFIDSEHTTIKGCGTITFPVSMTSKVYNIITADDRLDRILKTNRVTVAANSSETITFNLSREVLRPSAYTICYSVLANHDTSDVTVDVDYDNAAGTVTVAITNSSPGPRTVAVMCG